MPEASTRERAGKRASKRGDRSRRYDVVALVSNDLVTDQRMQRSLTTLAEAGYRCLLLGRRRPGSLPLDDAWSFDQERLTLAAHAGKAFYWQLHRAQRRRLLELRPRLILAVDLDTVWAARRASRRLGIPFVFDAHELFEEQPEVARRPHIKLAWYLLGKWCVPHATAAYTVGRDIAAILSRRYGLPFGVVRNFPIPQSGPAPAVLRKHTPGQPFTVLYQGALNEGRGIEELIDAAVALPDVRVLIAGDGPEGERLRAYAKTRHAANVTFLGMLPPDELRALTPTVDLGYALMRRVSLNYYLSLSNKTADYVQAGLPSLQMDWPEYRRLQERYGCFYLVQELTVRAVVEAIRVCRKESVWQALRAGCVRGAGGMVWEGAVLRTTIRPLLR